MQFDEPLNAAFEGEKMSRKSFIAVVVAASFIAVPMFSAVVWTDISAGTAFVGKGDVQLALGYNNKQMQSAEANLFFHFTDEASYALTCVREEWTGGKEPKLHTNVQNKTRTRQLSSALSYDSRKANQVTGFWLTGWSGVPVIDGSVPQCGGNTRPFNAATDFDINDDGFVVTCENVDGVYTNCTYMDNNGASDNEKGPFATYSVPTVVGSTGGLLTVKHTQYGQPGVVWPLPVIVP